MSLVRKLIGNMVQKYFSARNIFFPQEIFFSARNIFFSARNIFFPQEIYFSPQEIYFFPQEIFFSARNIFLRKKYIFLRKKYIFPQEINFSPQEIYFFRKKYFFPQEIFFSARNISSESVVPHAQSLSQSLWRARRIGVESGRRSDEFLRSPALFGDLWGGDSKDERWLYIQRNPQKTRDKVDMPNVRWPWRDITT